MVITEDVSFELADAADCRQLAERVGPGWTVAYDAERGLDAFGKNDLVLITDSSARIVYLRQGADSTVVDRVLDTLLP